MTDQTNLTRLADYREETKPPRQRAQRVTLTDKRIKSATSGDKRIRIADADLIGLHLVVQPSGSKSFVARGRVGGGRSRPMIDVTLGQYPVTSLAEARTRAKVMLAQMRTGVDPRGERPQERSVADVVASYLEDHRTRQTARVDNIERCLARATKNNTREPFDEVSLETWANAISRTHKKLGLSAAQEDRKWLIALARWALSKEKVTRADVLRLPTLKPSKAEKAARKDAEAARWTLRQDEWSRFWLATGTARSPHFRDFMRCLALSGLRCKEASLARWDHIDLDAAEWLIPAAHTKTGERHTVHIGPLLRSVLEQTPRMAGTDLVFPGRGNTVMSGWSKMVPTVSKSFGQHMQLHGLRRGYRTALSELRVDRDIAEAMIAHAQPDLAKRYNVAELADERRAAQLKLEEAFASAIGEGGPDA